MKPPINPWLSSTKRAAERLIEDSDRKTLAALMFQRLITNLHTLCTTGPHNAPAPKLSRVQPEDGGVSLEIEWLDQESGWFLIVSVHRKLGIKPRVRLEFSGNPKTYFADDPTEQDLRQALHDYFQEWKTE